MCKFFKTVKTWPIALAIRKIKPSAHCLDANKALGFALCFIDLPTACLMLYFTYSTRGHALINNIFYVLYITDFTTNETS